MSDKRIAFTVGLLFIMSTASFMLGDALIQSVLNTSPLVGVNSGQLTVGVLLKLLNSVFVWGIGILLFPILKSYSELIAVGYVATRILEAMLLAVGTMSLLLLAGWNQENPESLVNLVSRWHSLSFSVAMLFLGVGSLVFCYALYKMRVIPRVISAIGLLGYVLLVINAVSELFGNPMQMGLLLPGAVFELAFPIWLFVKGFNMSPKNCLVFRQQERI